MENLNLTDEQLETVVNNVACTPDGLKLLGHILSMSDMFDRSFNGNSKDIYLKGRRDFGVEIRELIIEHAFDKYVELLRKGAKQNEQG